MKWLAGSIAVSLVLGGCDCGNGGNHSAAKWLDLEIEHPPVEKSEPLTDRYGDIGEDGLVTNTYIVPPSFQTSAPRVESGNAAPDPFAAPAKNPLPPKRMTAQEVLEAYGVEFGPRSNAHYDPKTYVLRVTQTLDQMDLVEAIIGSGHHCGQERTLAFHYQIFELPAREALELEQSAGERFEHSREYEAIIGKVRDETARIVTTARLICRSGQRARIEDAMTVRSASGSSAKAEKDDLNPPLPVFAITKAGTVIEADPVLGPDNRTIDVNFELSHHLAPPVWPDSGAGEAGAAPRFFVGSLSASEMMIDGQVKLLCSWTVPSSSPGAKPLRRLVFVTANVVKG